MLYAVSEKLFKFEFKMVYTLGGNFFIKFGLPTTLRELRADRTRSEYLFSTVHVPGKLELACAVRAAYVLFPRYYNKS